MKAYSVRLWEPCCDPGGYQWYGVVLAKSEVRAIAAARLRAKRRYPSWPDAGITWECVPMTIGGYIPKTTLGAKLAKWRYEYQSRGGHFLTLDEIDGLIREPGEATIQPIRGGKES